MEDTEGLAQALEYVGDLAAKAADLSPKILDMPNEKPGTYAIINPKDGTLVKAMRSAPWIDHKFRTPGELRNFINASEKATSAQSAVFVGDAAAVFAFDREDARNRASCTLVEGEQWKTIAALPSARFAQREFIALLRIGLRGCLLGDSNLLAIVRDLRFNTAGEGTGTIQHGSESLGKSLVARVAGIDAIPEGVYLSVQVFENWAQNVTIPCAIDILTQEQQFRLVPYPGELRKAKDETLAGILEFLAGNENEVPAYLGTV
jgi:hypothetical protein